MTVSGCTDDSRASIRGTNGPRSSILLLRARRTMTAMRQGRQSQTSFNAETQRNASAIADVGRKQREFLWMNCHAKRLECVELAPALAPSPYDSASKLVALQTLRAARLRFCRSTTLCDPLRLCFEPLQFANELIYCSVMRSRGFHAAASVKRARASSKPSMACWRVTEGKSSRNSSNE